MSLGKFFSEKKNSRIALITACGEKKNLKPMEAYKLYRSSRIRAVYNRRRGNDMYLLSAKNGLVGAHEIMEPYDRLMNDERAHELVPYVEKRIAPYDYVVYFKGGAREVYLNCIKEACKRLGKILVTLGYAFMGGINDLPKIISMIRRGEWEKIQEIEHAEVLFFN